MADEVTVSVDERGVMLATLNRPDVMNALNGDLSAGLLAAIRRATDDPAVRVLVLTGAGRAFCAGAEIGPTADPTTGAQDVPAAATAPADGRSGSAVMVEAFLHCTVPVIGAINGAAAGAGFGIALCCDIRFAGESGRLGPIFIRRGLASDYGAAYWLPRIVGFSRALEIFYDGGLVEAPRALEIGLVNRVVADERLLDETLEYAAQIADGPPLAYAAVREILHRSTDIEVSEFLDAEWASQVALLRTGDAAEGFRAFIERREPRFTGS